MKRDWITYKWYCSSWYVIFLLVRYLQEKLFDIFLRDFFQTLKHLLARESRVVSGPKTPSIYIIIQFNEK